MKRGALPLVGWVTQQEMAVPLPTVLPGHDSSDERNEAEVPRRKEGEPDVGPYLQFRGWIMGIFQLMAVC